MCTFANTVQVTANALGKGIECQDQGLIRRVIFQEFEEVLVEKFQGEFLILTEPAEAILESRGRGMRIAKRPKALYSKIAEAIR